MSTAPQPAANPISPPQSSPGQAIRQENPKPKAQVQSMSPLDGEKQVKNRRNRRNFPASVSAVQDNSTPTGASAATVLVSSGRVDPPTAERRRAKRRPQTHPRAEAVAASNTSSLSVPMPQSAAPGAGARGRNQPRKAEPTAAVAGGVPQVSGSQSHVSQGIHLASLHQPPNNRRNLATSQLKRLPESESQPVSPEEKAARKKEQQRLKKAKRKEDHLKLVFSAANATLNALNKQGLSYAAFGSLACKLYGEFRDPKDVDVLILQPPEIPSRTAEQVKTLILDADPRHFFLKLPRDPTAPYRKLYYRSHSPRGECKVDILIPGTMYLPDFSLPSSRKHITTISGIPLVPFSLLLLHKLQGWSDHLNSPEQHKQRRHGQDAADVRRLLAMEARLDNLRETPPWNDSELFCEEFQQLTRGRVKEYCRAFPNRAVGWQLLGFETSSEASSELTVNV